ncbi:polymorphic toxin-type HINT domain-containing protein [Nocardiopsis sp. NPDC006198]|uniref:polymorphic toxin-type HINT domain-containing protein n=1 Tax=Nocardiopsis sp. NPDC006198 TaxID=3154472 RepID=UPI0033B956B6
MSAGPPSPERDGGPPPSGIRPRTRRLRDPAFPRSVGRGEKVEARNKLIAAAAGLAQLVADELGITAGLECFTTGDLGACGETALNGASMFVGGLAGKIAVKYGLRWGKAAELGRRIADLGGELIDGVNGLIRANRKVDNLCAPGNSFVPGTRVVMAAGSPRPIEEVDVGDQVLATDPETGERTARTVLATIIGSGAKHLVQIMVDPTTEREAADEDAGSEAEGEQIEQAGIPGPVTAGDVVIATDEHPFWVPDLGQWVDAVDLAPGTWLQTSSGTWVQVSAVRAWTQSATVHNLTVQGVHTFHVAVGDLNVLNHNANCGPGTQFDLPDEPGIYTIRLKDGNKYVGSSTSSMRQRVNKSMRSKHAVRRAGYSHGDVNNVTHVSLLSGVSSQATRRLEQTTMEGLKSRGVTVVNRRDPEIQIPMGDYFL